MFKTASYKNGKLKFDRTPAVTFIIGQDYSDVMRELTSLLVGARIGFLLHHLDGPLPATCLSVCPGDGARVNDLIEALAGVRYPDDAFPYITNLLVDEGRADIA